MYAQRSETAGSLQTPSGMQSVRGTDSTMKLADIGARACAAIAPMEHKILSCLAAESITRLGADSPENIAALGARGPGFVAARLEKTNVYIVLLARRLRAVDPTQHPCCLISSNRAYAQRPRDEASRRYSRQGNPGAPRPSFRRRSGYGGGLTDKSGYSHRIADGGSKSHNCSVIASNVPNHALPKATRQTRCRRGQ